MFITSVHYFLQLLPTPVDPEEAEEMFDFADKNKDSKIGWEEFQVYHFFFQFPFRKSSRKISNPQLLPLFLRNGWEEFQALHFHFPLSNWAFVLRLGDLDSGNIVFFSDNDQPTINKYILQFHYYIIQSIQFFANFDK